MRLTGNTGKSSLTQSSSFQDMPTMSEVVFDVSGFLSFAFI